MKPQNFLTTFTLFLWLVIGINCLIYQIFTPNLPNSIVLLLNSNSWNIYAQILYGVYLASLALATDGIWRNKPSARANLGIAIIASAASVAILGLLHGTYLRIAGIDELKDIIIKY